MPTPRELAALDQIRAAAADARQVAETLAGQGLNTKMPDWLAPHIATLRQAIANQTETGCPHRWVAAQILHAAVWAPGVITCTWCTPLLAAPASQRQTCDRCQQPAPRLLNGAVITGPIVLAFGICPPCHTGQPAGTTRKETPR